MLNFHKILTGTLDFEIWFWFEIIYFSAASGVSLCIVSEFLHEFNDNRIYIHRNVCASVVLFYGDGIFNTNND